MAITKQKKAELMQTYQGYFKNSRTAIIVEYTGLSVKALDQLRAKLREVGGEFHVIKNTIARVALKEMGYDAPEKALVDSTAIAFGFEDAPATAKVMTDAAKGSDFLKIKGAYLSGHVLGASQVQALADLPPLPVMRAQLLGTISAPATKLVRTLAEPGRSVAAVIKAYADQDAAPAA